MNRNKIRKIRSAFGVMATVLVLAGCGQVQGSPSAGLQVQAGTPAIQSETASTSSEQELAQESAASSVDSDDAAAAASSGLADTDAAEDAEDAVITTEQPEINASEIWDKYDKDPEKNTPTYDGDQETVTGVITYIGKDDHGTDSMQISDTKGGTSYVLGVFGSAQEMSAVSVGDTVTITGNFHIMSSHDMVVLKQCRILTIYR